MGSPELSTTDELMEHLLAVKAAYPDVAPLAPAAAETLSLTTGWSGLGWWRAAFGVQAYYEEEDGSISGWYNDPNADKVITFINDLYLNGLYTREDFVEDPDAYNKMCESGDIYMKFGHPNDTTLYAPAGNPDVMYIASPMVDDWLACQQENIAWMATFITSNCKDPEAAIKALSWLCSDEGDIVNQWGIEGEDYEYDENGVPNYTDWYYEQTEESLEDYNSNLGRFLGSMNWADHLWTSETVPDEVENLHEAREQAQDHWVGIMNMMSINPNDSSEAAVVFQQCKDAWTAAIPNIIMAESNEEALRLFDELKATLEDMNISVVEEYWTAKSDKVKEAFGEENCILEGADTAIYHEWFD